MLEDVCDLTSLAQLPRKLKLTSKEELLLLDNKPVSIVTFIKDKNNYKSMLMLKHRRKRLLTSSANANASVPNSQTAVSGPGSEKVNSYDFGGVINNFLQTKAPQIFAELLILALRNANLRLFLSELKVVLPLHISEELKVFPLAYISHRKVYIPALISIAFRGFDVSHCPDRARRASARW